MTDDSTPPRALLVFDGYRYASTQAWEDAFAEWCDARQRWVTQRHLDVLLPMDVNGDCPFDPAEV